MTERRFHTLEDFEPIPYDNERCSKCGTTLINDEAGLCAVCLRKLASDEGEQ